MPISIVIRTYNEQRHLPSLLDAIKSQRCSDTVEVILVDSGSIDATLEIARSHSCRILSISKDEFTFGRSLNMGCAAAGGNILVFVSGHCIPTDEHWLERLTRPVADGRAVYCYGRQLGGTGTKFSESRIFGKYYPDVSAVPQEGFFCNNANAALDRRTWETWRFDEQLTGLEDMDLAKRLVANGARIGYVADAAVFHLHDESWRAIKNRFEREAIALQGIMPQVHISFGDFVTYVSSAIMMDLRVAFRQRTLLRHFRGIAAYRLMQFWGSYAGNNEHRKLSRAMKDKYFYPT